MGFKIEEIVHPEAYFMARQFVCSVCLCIVEDPVQTACDHIFCAACVATSLACPTCRAEFVGGQVSLKPLHKHNKPLLRMMHELKVWCPYHAESKVQVETSGEAPSRAKRPRTEEYCTWEGSFMDLLAIHLKRCPFHSITCPNGCGENVRRKDLEAHDRHCEQHFQTCSICKVRVRAIAMAEHRLENAQLHVQLLEAQVLELQAAKAQSDDLKAFITETVTEQVKAQCDDLRMSIKADVSMRLKQHRGPWSIKWTVNVSTEFVREQKVQSPHFDLCGFTGFYIQYFPAGCNDTRAGKAALFLYGPKNVLIRARFQVDTWEATLSKERLAESGPGFNSGPLIPAVPSNVVVIVEVLSFSIFSQA